MKALKVELSQYGVVLLARMAATLPCRDEADFRAAAEIEGCVSQRKGDALAFLRKVETELGNPMERCFVIDTGESLPIHIATETRDWVLKRVSEVVEPGWIASARLAFLSTLKNAVPVDI